MPTCACCGDVITIRKPDPWEGRMDNYCDICCLARCDAYPEGCKAGPAEVAQEEQDDFDAAAKVLMKYLDQAYAAGLANESFGGSLTAILDEILKAWCRIVADPDDEEEDEDAEHDSSRA